MSQNGHIYYFEEKPVQYQPSREQPIIEDYLSYMGTHNNFFVDIGALDGLTYSNTFFLTQNRWRGVCIECEQKAFATLAYMYRMFPEINLCRMKITPDNVVALLIANHVPRNVDFLNLDIDGYDYFVLEKILETFRPMLICTEINEKIPPPIKFTVKYNPQYTWAEDHFYGQSISQLHILCEKYRYALIKLNGINAYLIPKEINPYPEMRAEQAYREGYLEHPRPEHNKDMEILLEMSPEEGVQFINQYFSKYNGLFICTL